MSRRPQGSRESRPGAPEASAGRRYWKSLETRASSPEFLEELAREMPSAAAELQESGVDRRAFLGLMGASLALAGVGCDFVRKPAQGILPYARRPEDLIPGRPLHYATSARIGGGVLGLLVESQDGRPTKIEGNPLHPMSLGATNAWAQAEVLALYDPDRSRLPHEGGSPSTPEAFEEFLATLLPTLRERGGRGLAILADHRPSPSWSRLLGELKESLPEARVFVHDPALTPGVLDGGRLSGVEGLEAVPDLSVADVVVAVDCDLLGVEGDAVRNARDFADGRRLAEPSDEMNRLYVVEPGFTVTGAMADHRLRLPARRARVFLEALAQALSAEGARAPLGSASLVRSLRGAGDDERIASWAREVARDLVRRRGRGVVVVGGRQPAEVHGLAHLVNQMISAPGRTVRFRPIGLPEGAGTLEDLAGALGRGEVSTLFTFGADPFGEAPADLDLDTLRGGVETVVHHGLHLDAVGREATWHVPASHFLEAWGDWEARDGTLSLQQPLIAPLFSSLSELELLARLAGSDETESRAIVRRTFDELSAERSPSAGAAFDVDAAWRRALHDGVVDLPPSSDPRLRFDWRGLGERLDDVPPLPAAGLEIDFALDPSLYDGRYANNAWLQELPDPITKVAWTNVATLSPATAAQLGIGEDENGARVNRIIRGRLHADVVRLELGRGTVEAPALILPGVADGVVMTTLGYGRQSGRVAQGVGHPISKLRSSRSPWFDIGARLVRTGEQVPVPVTQDHWTLVEPLTGHVRDGLVREGTIEQWREQPEFVRELDVMEAAKIESPWEEPALTGDHQWGMAIDLTTCTGCSTCTIACQAENNIPVVGAQRVLDGREMHWIRVDRYFTGEDDDDLRALVQPVPCMHCENAPCEQVCPVAATTHSPEGLNDMAYNRCIGTRYCANNCPYKVRRFNFFNFTQENVEANPLQPMQSNPDVTVRFRGVIEKCTYCVQRIQQAKIDAKVHGDGKVVDGAITPACAQACPTRAIVFGDVSDPDTHVSRLKRQSRDYGMLTELNTQPRTTYLAKLRNPNPALEPEPLAAAQHQPAGEHAKRERH